MKQLTIESYGDGAISIAHYPFETHFNKQEVAEIRAYLNKDVMAELERLKVRPKSYDEYQDGVNTGYEMGCNKAIALLCGDRK